MHTPMPEKGRESAEILEQLEDFRAQDPHYKQGRVWSLVYYLDEDHSGFLKDAYHSYASENGLNPGAFKSLKRLENEIISATADILNGTEEVCGVVTSGGTESCLMAVKTYRDMAREKRGAAGRGKKGALAVFHRGQHVLGAAQHALGRETSVARVPCPAFVPLPARSRCANWPGRGSCQRPSVLRADPSGLLLLGGGEVPDPGKVGP